MSCGHGDAQEDALETGGGAGSPLPAPLISEEMRPTWRANGGDGAAGMERARIARRQLLLTASGR